MPPFENDTKPFGAVRSALNMLTVQTPHTGVFSATGPCRALWVETAGILIIKAAEDSDFTTLSVPANTLFPVSVVDIDSGTTASSITALF